jgi:hypothetical protein
VQATPSNVTCIDRERQPLTQQALYPTSPHFHEQSSHNTISVIPSFSAEFDVDVASNIDLSPLDSFPFPELTAISQDQVDFCIRQFKACVQLVQQNRSPFIHPSSYQYTSSTVYQDLLCVSAMYCLKSPRNQAVVLQMLDHKVSSLILSSNSSSWLIQDYLAGVQALLFYQIIRLFDRDIRQWANAERHFATLEAWTMQLRSTANVFHNDSSSDKCNINVH